MPWIGVREFEAAFVKVAAQADAAARANVAAGAAALEKAAKGNFSGSHRRGGPHIGGDRPNIVTGTLRRSIRHDPITRLGLGDYATRVGPSVIYARSVELGNKPGMKGYPYFEPAFEQIHPVFEAIAVRNWRRFLFA